MSDDLFHAHIKPQRGPTASEAWPQDWDENPDAGIDDLMASFDLHRLELDGRLAAAAVETSQGSPGSGTSDPARAARSASPMPELDEASPEAPAWTGVPAGPVLTGPVLTGPVLTGPVLTGPVDPGPVHPGLVHTDPVHPGPVPLPSRRSVVVEHRSRKPWLIAGTALVVAACAGTGFAALDHSRSPSGPGPGTGPGVAAPSITAASASAGGTQAADWIVANVGPGRVVACDVTVCALLRGDGFPDSSLITVQSGQADVVQADLVVVTDVIRRQLGSGLATVTAAEPLAVFASDASAVEITPVAPGGASAYAGRAAADRASRRSAGVALLRNPKITYTAEARTSLSDGLVDSRLCVLLAVLGGSHRIGVASFIDAGPGAGPDIPRAGVVIATVDGVDAAQESPQTAALKGIVAAQRAPYAPLSTTPVVSGADHGLAVLFSQPGPIGLLNATTP